MRDNRPTSEEPPGWVKVLVTVAFVVLVVLPACIWLGRFMWRFALA